MAIGQARPRRRPAPAGAIGRPEQERHIRSIHPGTHRHTEARHASATDRRIHARGLRCPSQRKDLDKTALATPGTGDPVLFRAVTRQAPIAQSHRLGLVSPALPLGAGRASSFPAGRSAPTRSICRGWQLSGTSAWPSFIYSLAEMTASLASATFEHDVLNFVRGTRPCQGGGQDYPGTCGGSGSVA
jgi:hypothetical protein